MRNAIPKALAYAKSCNTIENNSYQAWLKGVVDREDLLWWAQKEEARPLLGEKIPRL